MNILGEKREMGRDLSPIKDTIANAPVKFERNKIEISKYMPSQGD
jgi:hypothetical protein